MSEVVETQTLEQSLNKTDLGHTIYENRKLFIALVVAVLLGTVGYAIWKQSHQSSQQEAAIKVFEFQTKVWTEAKASKISADDLMKSFGELSNEVKSSALMLPISLEMSKFFYDQNKFAEADSVLSSFDLKKVSPITGTIVSLQHAVVLENLGKLDEAIAGLEIVAQNKDSIMKPKLFLEIGRLALAKGDKVKAKTNFEYVLSDFPNDEYAKLAKLYLAEVK
jgi:predicted negative regulator of RcsB-dependent stress response